MAWVNGPLKLFHGTTGAFADDIARGGIKLARCRPKSDFGLGFYVTDWHFFVQYCRVSGGPHVPLTKENYEVVYGPLALLDGRSYPPDYEQVSFHNPKNFHMLALQRVIRGIPYL
jgi:hypothetical protein